MGPCARYVLSSISQATLPASTPPTLTICAYSISQRPSRPLGGEFSGTTTCRGTTTTRKELGKGTRSQARPRPRVLPRRKDCLQSSAKSTSGVASGRYLLPPIDSHSPLLGCQKPQDLPLCLDPLPYRHPNPFDTHKTSNQHS